MMRLIFISREIQIMLLFFLLDSRRKFKRTLQIWSVARFLYNIEKLPDYLRVWLIGHVDNLYTIKIYVFSLCNNQFIAPR